MAKKNITKTENKLNFRAIMDMAVQVSDRVQLEDVRLLGCNCELQSLSGEGEKSFEVTRTTDFSVDPETSMIFVVVHFVLDAVKDRKQNLAKIKADMLLVYKIRDIEGLTDQHFRSFADQNAVFNAWPYWREFIQNMTTRMQLPPLTLPVHRFGMSLSEKSSISRKKKAKKVISKRAPKATKKTAKSKATKK